MKKILSLFVASTVLVGLFACAKQPKPEDTVKDFFEAAKTSDTAKMNACVTQDSKSALSSSSSEISSGDKKVEKEFENYFKSNLTKITYDIKSSDIKDNSATVTVDCKFIDGSSIIRDSISNYMAKAIAQAFSGGSGTNSGTTQKEFETILSDKVKNTKETFINKTIKINCTKTGDKWYISKVDDDLQNILLSNFLSIKNDLSKLTGNANSASDSPANKLMDIESFAQGKILSGGFADIASYQETGKSASGESIDIDLTLQQLDSNMKKKTEYDSYIKGLSDSKYSSLKTMWEKFSSEADNLYSQVKAKKIKANDQSNTIDYGKLTQYFEAFSDEIGNIK